MSTGLPIEIRCATEQEARQFFLAYLQETYPHNGHIPPDPDNVEIAITQILDPKLSFVAVLDGAAIGGAFYVRVRSPFKGVAIVGQDFGFWVHPDYRSMGVATSLAKHAIEVMRGMGVSKVLGCVKTSNTAALAFVNRFSTVNSGMYEVDLTVPEMATTEGKA